MGPLGQLAEFVSHEQQFLARIGEQVRVQQAQASEAAPLVPGHLCQHRTFAVNDLVVRERQHEILGEGVQDAERHTVLVVLAMDWVGGHVRQRIMHPSQIPLVSEAQPAIRGGP